MPIISLSELIACKGPAISFLTSPSPFRLHRLLMLCAMFSTLEFFQNGAELLLNSVNWAQFKDHVSHMYLVDAVVASWSLTQEVSFLALLL